LMVNFTTELRGKVYYEFFNGEGSRIDYGTIGHFERGKHAIKIAPPEFPNGTYMLNIQIGKRPHAFFVYRYNQVDWKKVEAEFEKRKKELQKR